MEQKDREQWLKNRVKTNITNLVVAKATNNKLAELHTLCYLIKHHLDLNELGAISHYTTQIIEVLLLIPFRKDFFRFPACLMIGTLYFFQKQFAEAIPYLHEALSFSSELVSPEKEAFILKTLGEAYFETGCLDESLICLEKAFILYQILNNTNQECHVLFKLSEAYLQLGSSNTAQQYLEALTKKTSGRGYEELNCKTLTLLAQLYTKVDKLDASLECFAEVAHSQLFELGDKESSSTTFQLLIAGLEKLKTKPKDGSFLYLGLNVALALKRDRELAFMLWKIGWNQRQGDYPRGALPYLHNALRIISKIEDNNLRGEILAELGFVHEALKHPYKALEYHEQAMSLFFEKVRAAEQAFVLAKAYEKIKRFRKAKEFKEKGDLLLSYTSLAAH